MAKAPAKFDRVLFIPARSPLCRLADTLLIFSIALAGVSASLLALINHLGAVK